MGIWRQRTGQKQQSTGSETFALFEATDPFDQDESFRSVFAPSQSIQQNDTSVLKPRRAAATAPKARVTPTVSSSPVTMNLEDWQRARSLRQFALYALFAAVVGVAGFATARLRPWALWGQQDLVYAYFEVRAVDASGRPVAGAVVKNAGKRVGTTDSFGEWRRYMRVPLGATVPVTLAKKTGNDVLYATKNFAVPPVKPEKNDLELRASVQLIPATLEQNSVANAAVQSQPNVAVREPAPNAAQINPSADHKTNDTLEAAALSEASGSTAITPKETAIASPVSEQGSSLGQLVSSHESVWFESAAPSTSSLVKDVLPALIQRAKELGLKVDPKATWRVQLTNLVDRPAVVDKEGGGLILIGSSDQQDAAPREFLRNYQNDSRMTARGILYVLAHHVNKNIAAIQKNGRWVVALPKEAPELWRLAGGMSLAGQGRVWLAGSDAYSDDGLEGYYLLSNHESPCAAGKSSCELKTRSFAEIPAVPTWTRLKLKVPGAYKDPVKVFVSGYEARPVSDNVWEYWGQDRARANVTLIQSGRVLHRMQIQNDARQPVVVATGSTAVSRR